MFVLVKLKDTVRIRPQDLAKDFDEVVRDTLQAKFANRVLNKYGLGITIYDFTRQENCVHASDGGAHVKVNFRLVVFRPFPGEVLLGTIRQCDSTGILVSVDFFDHIYIPAAKLQVEI